MKLKKTLAVMLAFMICVSFMPVMSATVCATEESLPDTTYTGTFPSLPSSGAEAIAQTALNLAWPLGTDSSKYQYPSGSARDNFQVAIDKVYPNRSSWGAQPKVGASCDVFVGTVLRYSGYDGSAPRGVTPALDYYPAHPEKWTDTGAYRLSDMQSGDVIVWAKSTGTKHTCIFLRINGTSYLAEAHYNGKQFGHISKRTSDYTPSNYSYLHVYRANQPYTGSIDKGCTGVNVQYLQEFLNWAGYDCGTPDGSFGAKTQTALKEWQTDACITVDGRFGKASLAAAKAFIPSKPPLKYASVTKSPAKVAYPGPWPTKKLKKKSKGVQVKYLQNFLCWYGISVKVDGKYGNGMKKAVKKFQKQNGLKQDGVFGSSSLKKAKSIRK